ncbi:MAG: chromosomal replication initiator protein DnaA, partial [Firmicutes bacterium]|nr:chromosomal replication initiator protein DnaA [Bacillota bacterium]
EMWSKMVARLEMTMQAYSVDTWIRSMTPLGIHDEQLVVKACAQSLLSTIVTSFQEKLNEAVRFVDVPSVKAVLLVPQDNCEEWENMFSALDKSKNVSEYIKPSDEGVQKYDSVPLNPKYNFESFVVGSSNKFSYAAAQAVAENPGQTYNPLFIYGGTGLGKTHLMQAIGNEVLLNDEKTRVLYVTSEKFVTDFITSIRTSKDGNSSFRKKYREADVLIVDDIQFIAGKEASQEEIFHTFNELHQAGKQIILACDRKPKEIQGLDDRLCSRFEWGMLVDVLPPDLETRISILQKKAHSANQNIDFEVLQLMAEKVESNVREMEGLLNKVILLARVHDKKPTVEIVQEVLKEIVVKSEENITSEMIIEKVCEFFNVAKNDLLGKKKNREVVEPRQICIYLITDLVHNMPLAKIGNIFGGRDHTTIMHARDKVAQKLETNIKTKVQISDIKDMLMRR